MLDWIASGLVDGLRIDHPDGLLDPLGYFQRLAERAFPERAGQRPPIFVEKILQPGERLRDDWPVAGSTGYDVMNQVEALFLDPAGAAQVERDYRRLVRRPIGFAALAYAGKRAALESGLSAGVRRLAQRLQRLSGPAGPSLLPPGELAAAIVETVAHLPVYRTSLDDRVARPEDGRTKLHLTRPALLGRREAPGIFTGGSYQALSATGPAATHVYASFRRGPEGLAVTVVPRLIARHLGPAGGPPGRGFWEGTRVLFPDGGGAARWRDALTGELRSGATALETAELFSTLPMALLRSV